jgi:histidine triad (HIT) family protein
MSENCLFCKIACGEIPSNKVYEDDELFAFHDIRPAAPVHFLLIPKAHLPSLLEVNESHAAMLGKMLVLASKLAKEQGLGSGFRTVINSGKGGGQEVFHLHMHIIGGGNIPPMVKRD